MRKTVTALLLGASLATAQEPPTQDVSAGSLYVLSEHQRIKKEQLQDITDLIRNDFQKAGITYTSATAVETFPDLKPLDALVIYLDTAFFPTELGEGKDDCPLSGTDVGASHTLSRGIYEKMRTRLDFTYDKETVTGDVVYVCPGRAILSYRMLRMLTQQDADVTVERIDRLLAAVGTHEVAHTLGAVHVVTGALELPAPGYFLGDITTLTDPTTRFHEENVRRMKEFITNAKDKDLRTLNAHKTLSLYAFIKVRDDATDSAIPAER